MKKIILTMIVALVAILPAAAKDRYSRSINDIPLAARTMIEKNFPKVGVSHIKIESHIFGGNEYDVVLNNGCEIDFDSDGNWKDINCGALAVPNALIPQAITNFVNKQHKGQKIVKIDKDRNKYEIELQNGLELRFDAKGNFLRYDD